MKSLLSPCGTCSPLILNTKPVTQQQADQDHASFSVHVLLKFRPTPRGSSDCFRFFDMDNMVALAHHRPEAQVTVSADPKSVGSTYEWKGNIMAQVRLLTETHSRQLIDDELLFLKPFKSKAQVRFELAPTSRGTKLTWVMDSSLPWFMFWMIPMMKTFIGMDYRRVSR